MKGIKEFFSLHKHPARTVILILLIFLAGFLVLGVASIQVWEYSNSTSFCAAVCHQVHPEEPAAFQDSYHASIKCVECHMGRTGTIRSMIIKTSHFKHLPAVIFRTYHRPVKSESMRPASESCERCHNSYSLHGDSLKENKYYLPDERNSERRLFLVLKTGGREADKGLTEGIHWHIANRVEYIATDEHRLNIPWVKVLRADGTAVEYSVAGTVLPAGQNKEVEKRVMDCLDCHNRVGHPFLTPEKTVDRALAEGKISPELPWAKKEITQLLSADYADQKEAVSAVEAWGSGYKEKYQTPGTSYPDQIRQAEVQSRELVMRLVFKNPGITWQSFPNQTGHKDFPGCFRCHDGKHISQDGQSIPLSCSLCHSLPVTTGPDSQPPLIPAASTQQPDSHRKPGFIFEHRILAVEGCTACHGPLQYGTDDSSFCANSACHGEKWAPFESSGSAPHPFPLTAGHSKPVCFQCHRGEEKPSNQCTNCHTGPKNHFTSSCDNCHSPEGWKQSVVSVVRKADKIPHPLEGMAECLICHNPNEQIKPAPVNHRLYKSNNQCTLCHKRIGV
ncbi:MAG: NapC/NirT family cytochrome c [Spirochaetota bacterium]